MPTKKEMDNWFIYHPPKTNEDVIRYQKIRDKAKEFAELVIKLTPPCADQSAAIRKIREAVMTANAAIACDVD
jgi:hypothetical protein